MKKTTSLSLIFLILLFGTAGLACWHENTNNPSSKTIYSSPPLPNKFDLPKTQTKKEMKGVEVARVIEVIDGDTIVVLRDGLREKVRLIGIDTPEVGHHYYEEATRKTTELVLGKTVRLEKDFSERDKYGRLLRYVYLGNLFVNAELVRQGYAYAYTHPPDVKYSDYFLKLQREAREKGVGLWSLSKQTPAKEKNRKVKYVASKKRIPFHYPWCLWAKQISPYNLQTFSSREEAIQAGHRPCKVCNP